MHIEALLPRQSSSSSCIVTCSDPPPCDCNPNQDCIQINRDCNTCATTRCVDKPSSGSSGGASKGATAGAIVGALVFLGIAIIFFLWYRRKSRIRQRLAAAREPPKDIPAAAETVLNRPDPTEKYVGLPTEANTNHVHPNSNTSIGPDSNPTRSSPHYNTSQRSNNDPFGDATSSIQTAGTEGTNVIPIALVPVDTQRSLSPSSTGHTHLTSSGSSPMRPARSPDLYLDHVNVSNDSLHPPAKSALSTRSGISGFTNRNSFGSNASFSSDLLNEAPMIITPSRGAVRQVVGVVKAEVINAPGPLASNSDSLKIPPNTRPVNKSPLASKSFVPGDINKDDDHHNDPFSDNASINAEYGVSPTLTTSTFAGIPITARESQQSDWIPDAPSAPWARSGDSSRPSSISTQSGSVVDIGSATRIHVGLSNTRSNYRTTMGRLISPSTPNMATAQDQDQRTQLPAQSQAQGLDGNRRVSSGSAISGTSTRADSILESFPFVPPSPISNRPVRSPPVSPLTQQSFNTATSPSPTSLKSQHVIKIAPPSPLAQDAFSDKPQANSQVDAAEGDSLPPPPSRQTLGMSTGSQLSTSTSGLGSFPFQIETGESSAPPSSLNHRHRQRASLDTLALTSDLSSYPLGFDRDSVQVPMPSTSTHKS